MRHMGCKVDCTADCRASYRAAIVHLGSQIVVVRVMPNLGSTVVVQVMPNLGSTRYLD